jgi:hypothetical protein
VLITGVIEYATMLQAWYNPCSRGCLQTRNCNQFFKTHQKAFDEAIAIEGDVKAMVTQLAGEKE